MAASETSNSLAAKTKSTKVPAALPDDCPPDVEALGRASWTLLHSVTAAYPEKPTLAEQSTAISFVKSFGKLYPYLFPLHVLLEVLAAPGTRV